MSDVFAAEAPAEKHAQMKPTGPWTLWLDSVHDGWRWQDFPTLEAAWAAGARHDCDFVVQRALQYQLTIEVVEDRRASEPPELIAKRIVDTAYRTTDDASYQQRIISAEIARAIEDARKGAGT